MSDLKLVLAIGIFPTADGPEPPGPIRRARPARPDVTRHRPNSKSGSGGRGRRSRATRGSGGEGRGGPRGWGRLEQHPTVAVRGGVEQRVRSPPQRRRLAMVGNTRHPRISFPEADCLASLVITNFPSCMSSFPYQKERNTVNLLYFFFVY